MIEKSVLVTGSTGFVGQRLIRKLVTDGFKVRAATRRDWRFVDGVAATRIGSLGESTQWKDAVAGCEVVIHLAARVHQIGREDQRARDEYFRVNCDGTARLAVEAAAAGVRRMIFVSTIKVNGEDTNGRQPFNEEDPAAPTDSYGMSKAEAEKRLFAIAAQTGIEITVIRPPLVYGPGVRANFLSMARWLAHGMPLPFGAITENRRSLVALDNLVSLMRTCVDHPKAAQEVFLVADGEDVSTAELLRRTAAVLGVMPRLLPVPAELLQASAVLLRRRALAQRLLGSLQVSAKKAREVLGWHPVVTLDEGLRLAVEGIGR